MGPPKKEEKGWGDRERGLAVGHSRDTALGLPGELPGSVGTLSALRAGDGLKPLVQNSECSISKQRPTQRGF